MTSPDLTQQIQALLDRPANLNDCEDYADAIREVLLLHHVTGPGGWCAQDGFNWPCDTLKALAHPLMSTPGDQQ